VSEIFFVLKTMLITVVIVTCLQIKIGQRTVEERSLSWMHRSVAIDALRGVADGAVVAIENGYSWGRTFVEKQMGKSGAKSRVSGWEAEAKNRVGEEVD
jgi:hypothetical protein